MKTRFEDLIDAPRDSGTHAIVCTKHFFGGMMGVVGYRSTSSPRRRLESGLPRLRLLVKSREADRNT
jgi:hypothetical protein